MVSPLGLLAAEFLDYALQFKIVEPSRYLKAHQQLSLFLKCEIPTQPIEYHRHSLHQLLDELIDESFRLGLHNEQTIDQRDCYESSLFDTIMPSPEEVTTQFLKISQHDMLSAVRYLYQLSIAVNYVKQERLSLNKTWTHEVDHHKLQLTINLAKPEKDPRAIAMQAHSTPHVDHAPRCALCKENVRYYPNARMNLRIVPLTLGGEQWYFQYSPYLYFQEHSIVFHESHRPMKISPHTIECLFDFVDQLPAYFIGSNADLPIVGGSILSHDHFQCGHHHFPLFDAKSWFEDRHNEVMIHLLDWPLSTVRLTSPCRDQLIELATHLMSHWKSYSDPTVDIIHATGDVEHQTVTPLVRKVNNDYIVYIILRNNRTTQEYPFGIFHPHEDKHFIKKENIGLIEAAGLAILPGRLKTELQELCDVVNPQSTGLLPTHLQKFRSWVETLPSPIRLEVLHEEVGNVFYRVLEDAGVYKQNSVGMSHFLQWISYCLRSARGS